MIMTVSVISSHSTPCLNTYPVPLHPAKCTSRHSVFPITGENSSHSLLSLSHSTFSLLNSSPHTLQASCLMKRGFPRSTKSSTSTDLFSSISFHDLFAAFAMPGCLYLLLFLLIIKKENKRLVGPTLYFLKSHKGLWCSG